MQKWPRATGVPVERRGWLGTCRSRCDAEGDVKTTMGVTGSGWVHAEVADGDAETMGIAGNAQKWPRAMGVTVETKGGPGYAQESARATGLPVETKGVTGSAFGTRGGGRGRR